jgi:hypothetical protein
MVAKARKLTKNQDLTEALRSAKEERAKQEQQSAEITQSAPDLNGADDEGHVHDEDRVREIAREEAQNLILSSAPRGRTWSPEVIAARAAARRLWVSISSAVLFNF